MAALIAGEIGVRLFWKKAPQVLSYRDELKMVQSPDMREGFFYKPNTRGVSAYCYFSINSQGLREREIPRKKAPGATRILASGDSLMFGAALGEEDTFPRLLEQTLNGASGGVKYEVINAGIVGYNFNQEVAGLRRIIPHYRPDVVLVALIYNDTELQGISPIGWKPNLRNAQKNSVPRRNPIIRRAYRFLLPEKGGTRSERLRYALANASRLYMFVALRLNNPYPPYMLTNREIALFRTPACQCENLFWDRFENNLAELKSLSEQYHFEPVIVFYMDAMMEGLPFNRMRAAVAEKGFRSLDLSYLWKDEKTYVRRYSLGWDHHPSRETNRLAAGAAAGFLSSQRLVAPTPRLAALFAPEKYAETMRARYAKHRRLEREQAAAFKAQSRKFSERIVFDKGDFPPDQLLYGWWDEDFSAKTGSPGLRWMITEASALLRNPGGKRSLVVEGKVPTKLLEKAGEYKVGVSFNCGKEIVTGPLKTSNFKVRVKIPKEALKGELLEVGVSSDVFTSPAMEGVDPKDLRVVGFGVRRIELR